jgi:sugar lactone lactonase YvrE
MSLVIDYSNGVFEAVPSGETVGTITGNATLDLTSGNLFNHTPTANTTFVFSNPPTTGSAYDMTLKVIGANVGEGYDVANGSYDSVSFSVTSQDTGPTGIYFKSDGTKFYISGTQNDAIYQYSLSTAWDMSTASYDNTSFSVSTQSTFPEDVQFKTDGTSFYVSDRANDAIYQYDLSTAWDISTASYASKSFSVNSQEGASFAIVFKPDGTKVYVVGSINDTVYQYSLSTAWDISTASYDSVSFSVATEESVPRALFFNPDGDKLWVLGASRRTYQYSLSTAWDVSTASYDSVNLYTFNEDNTPQGLFFKSDGSKLYVIGDANDTVYQYTTGSSSLATIAWPSSVKWAGGTAPSAPAVGEKDVYNFFTLDGGTTYYGFQAGDAMA